MRWSYFHGKMDMILNRNKHGAEKECVADIT